MWNVPVRLAGHEAAACRCALKLQSCLMDLMKNWERCSYPEVRFRMKIVLYCGKRSSGKKRLSIVVFVMLFPEPTIVFGF